MITLDVPIVSQLTGVTTDHQPSENKFDDCVAACVLMLTMYLKGVRSIGGIYTPDNFKDKAAGQGTVGFTAAAQYIAYCASLGIRLYKIDGDPAFLIGKVRSLLADKKPVIFTEPDPYVAASLGWSHVCIFSEDTDSGLVAIDPYSAKTVERSYSAWQSLLQFNQVWTGEVMQQHISTPNESPNSDDLHVWNMAAKIFGEVPLVPEHGIPQSWLRAKHIHHVELGPPLEVEQDTGPDIRQLFGGCNRAVYTKANGITTWYLSSGAIVF